MMSGPDLATENDRSLHFMVGGLHSKVDLIITSQRDQAAHNNELGARISAVEKKQYLHTGAAGMLGAVLTAFFGHTFKWPF